MLSRLIEEVRPALLLPDQCANRKITPRVNYPSFTTGHFGWHSPRRTWTIMLWFLHTDQGVMAALLPE